mgnify:CR=1 FL=1
MSGIFNADFSLTTQVKDLKRTAEVQEEQILKRAKKEEFVAGQSSVVLGSNATGVGKTYSELSFGTNISVTGQQINVTGMSATPGGPVDSVQFNDSGSTNGASGLLYTSGSETTTATNLIVNTSLNMPNNTITTTKIADNQITLQKIVDMTSISKLLGSGTSGTSVSELSLGTNLSMSGVTLNVLQIPTFLSQTLSNTSNQLILGTTRTTTINAVQPATTSRSILLPDPGTVNTSFALINETTAPSNGKILIGNSTGAMKPAFVTAGTNIVTTTGAGSLEIATSTTPIFGSSSFTDTADQLTFRTVRTVSINVPDPTLSSRITLPYPGATAPIQSTFALINTLSAPAPGQILIGSKTAAANEAAMTPAFLTEGTNIDITNASGSVTIATSSTPTFTSTTLEATSNQLVLGTMDTTTLSSVVPAASRTYTIQDAGADANVALIQSPYVIGDIPYAGTTTTLTKLPAVIVGSVLASTGTPTPTAPTWSATPSTTSFTVNGGTTDSLSTVSNGLQIKDNVNGIFRGTGHMNYLTDHTTGHRFAANNVQQAVLGPDLIVGTGIPITPADSTTGFLRLPTMDITSGPTATTGVPVGSMLYDSFNGRLWVRTKNNTWSYIGLTST